MHMRGMPVHINWVLQAIKALHVGVTAASQCHPARPTHTLLRLDSHLLHLCLQPAAVAQAVCVCGSRSCCHSLGHPKLTELEPALGPPAACHVTKRSSVLLTLRYNLLVMTRGLD